MMQKWAPQTRYSLWRNTASKMKDLIYFHDVNHLDPLLNILQVKLDCCLFCNQLFSLLAFRLANHTKVIKMFFGMLLCVDKTRSAQFLVFVVL